MLRETQDAPPLKQGISQLLLSGNVEGGRGTLPKGSPVADILHGASERRAEEGGLGGRREAI